MSSLFYKFHSISVSVNKKIKSCNFVQEIAMRKSRHYLHARYPMVEMHHYQCNSIIGYIIFGNNVCLVVYHFQNVSRLCKLLSNLYLSPSSIRIVFMSSRIKNHIQLLYVSSCFDSFVLNS